jgi:hypothetical protein
MALRPRSGLSVRQVDGETVILDRDREQLHQLSETASFVWSRLDGMLTESEIARELTRAFDVSASDALRDVEHLIEELGALDLICRTNEDE